MIASLLEPDAVAAGLVWVGAAVLLGALVEFAGPAMLAVVGMVWAAGLLAALGAVGGPAAPSLLLTPALVAAIGWLVWDRAGRPELLRAAGASSPRSGSPSPRPSRAAAAGPLADGTSRATRAASRHVSAALHGAGSRAGLP